MLRLWYFGEASSPFRPRFFSLGIRLIGVSSQFSFQGGLNNRRNGCSRLSSFYFHLAIKSVRYFQSRFHKPREPDFQITVNLNLLNTNLAKTIFLLTPQNSYLAPDSCQLGPPLEPNYLRLVPSPSYLAPGSCQLEPYDFQLTISNPSTDEKCLSWVKTGWSCCLANAEIQRSFCGMGFPFALRVSAISA